MSRSDNSRMIPVLIEIDPNVRVRGNKTFSGFEDIQAAGQLTRTRLKAPVSVGDKVLAWESEDEIVTDAEVVDVDTEKRLVYLAVDWHGWRDRADGDPRPKSMLQPVTFSGDGDDEARRVPMRAVDETEDEW